MTRTVTVLTNPAAGNGRAPAITATVTARLRERGLDVTTIEGRTQGDALDSVKRVVRTGTDTVVVVGGDGIVNLALQAVATTSTALAVVPAGTGNDLARLLGVPQGDPVAAADIVARDDKRTMDLGRAGDRWFGTVMSSGFDSLVTERANRMRWPRGPLRYNLAMVLELTRLHPIPYSIELDDATIDLEATLVTVGNGPTYGGGMAICPDARVDDGLLDVTVVRASSRTRLVRLSPTLYKGTHVDLPEVDTYRSKRVSLSAPSMVAYADGERFRPLPIRIEAVPRALTVIVGETSPLHRCTTAS
ncbi:diacylglycerol kinase [Rhodococcoides kyotonense]|uniref:Diacylglycerol kinase (ATP) n=1 Tax=Rhodococcoides kyotonense TaxID=398843 RepID=A0A239D2U2_9NOCA|nr:diacylglycerol kinase [Rhodococcus kyotonensis]SNS26348.1 diacylglycerol kinase (ATP) [Rhodococcus kyotonensis]